MTPRSSKAVPFYFVAMVFECTEYHLNSFVDLFYTKFTDIEVNYKWYLDDIGVILKGYMTAD